MVYSNACTDGTREYLNDLAAKNNKIITILSDKNDVFVRPNNHMMMRHVNSDVVLLNNDVVVTPNWLNALHKTAYASESYGIVGAKILYPDNRLQEFGSEIFADGTGRNIGKGEDPDLPEYNRLSETGYVSGCTMFIKRSTIEKTGVFDDAFHPCYFEDADYCYTAKEHGLATVVTPDSIVYHDEGGTAGTDTSDGYKAYQEVNAETFLKKHLFKDNGIDWDR
jgi:O-antigen biosynthesis protein